MSVRGGCDGANSRPTAENPDAESAQAASRQEQLIATRKGVDNQHWDSVTYLFTSVYAVS